MVDGSVAEKGYRRRYSSTITACLFFTLLRASLSSTSTRTKADHSASFSTSGKSFDVSVPF
jgi:hypothetical protein